VEAPPDDEADRTAAASAPAIDRSVKTRAMDEAPVGITVADATRPDMPLVYANGAFERITGYPSSYAIGRNCRFLQGEDTREEPVARLREAIEAAESTSVVLRNYRRNGNVFWNEVTIAPLRNDRGEVVYYVGFQQDVTRRKRAERAAARRATRIDRERAAQQRLLERLDGVVVDATAAVTEARSRTTLESGVVERLAETYAGAWIGAYDPADGAVVPRADAGTTGADGPPERVDVGTAAETTAVDAAVSRAIDHERVEVRPPGDGGPVVAGVPLHYGAATYGAVCVYARGGAGFDDHERAVLTALGRVIGTGLNALESHRTLRADGSVELRFGLQDHPLVPVADALGAHLTYAGTVSDRDRPTVLYEVEGAGAPTTRDAVSTSPADLRAVLVADDDACLVELTLPERGLHDLPTEYGATLCGATVDGATARVTVEVARESLARSLAEAVTDRFDGAEVTGYRRRDRSPETRREFVATLKRDLTDRQYAALLRAYTGGFFEWPHEATGEDLADAMDISRSTFHQHLRAAERKLVAAVLGDEADPN
jgi:PAS domain S-box-containing protein